jgi:prophage antirepressor-like protein
MNALQSYQFQSHQFRVIPDAQGEPWFIAKDVCDILGYTNSSKSVSDHCRKSGVTNRYIPALSNTYTLIDEGNLYRLIIKSNKPESEPFESWVCDEVLPALRKTGSYGVSHEAFKLSYTPEEMEDLVNRRVAESSVSLQNKYITLLEQENSRLKASEPTVVGLPRKWSAADDQTLLALKAQGLGYTRIGFKMGRSGNSIKHRYVRLMAQGGV